MMRHLAALAAVTLLLGCTAGGVPAPTHPAGSPSVLTPDPKPPAAPTGDGSAAAVLAELCDTPSTPDHEAKPQKGPVPQIVSSIEEIVQQVRGLTFEHPVPVEPLTNGQIDAKLRKLFQASVSTDQVRRRGLAWETIGVIPAGTDLFKAFEAFYQGQVIGFYVPETGQLVFVGNSNPSAIEKITLAHELTHALDDQHFDLTRVDRFGINCRDELQMAALGAIEGNAQFFSIAAAAEMARRGTLGDLGSLGSGDATTPGVPPFLMNLELWPYTTGLAFITTRDSSGGTTAVNAVIRRLPVSTEQVIHPERYPNDTPQPLDVPDLGPKLGAGWTDLDVSEIGEAWLSIMLDLRLNGTEAQTAAAGWDGGIYRAWSNGNHVAVVMNTVWDTPADAAEFTAAVESWIADGVAFVQAVDATHVSIGFASDATTLSSLKEAAP